MRIKRKFLIIGLIIAGYSYLILSLADVFPLWDAWAVFQICIIPSVLKPFSIFNFDCGGHPSMIYYFILGISQYLVPGNLFLVHATNLALGILALIAFYKILTFIASGKEYEVERIMMLFLYAFFPIIVANTLHFNPDFGMLVFILLTLAIIIVAILINQIYYTLLYLTLIEKRKVEGLNVKV